MSWFVGFNYPASCIKRTNNLADFCAVVNHHKAVQDKTIDNALIALYPTGEGLDYMEVLMAMRGVPRPAPKRPAQFKPDGCL